MIEQGTHVATEAEGVTATGLGSPFPPEPLAGSFPLVELRQYTLHEGARDTLIELFEREFIESQEAVGMKVIGTFLDLDRPERFVWLRGFRDMESRLAGLSSFYGGAVWQEHRDRANATMIDSDNVLLLHAPDAAAEFHLSSPGPGIGERGRDGLVIATILYLNGECSEAARLFAAEVKPFIDAAGIPLLGWFVSETAPNNFPRLPVRESDKVLVWFAGFSRAADYARRVSAMTDAIAPLEHMLVRAPEVLRLKPTARSQLRGPSAMPDGGTDFDFLIGRWAVTHRKLKQRGVGCTEWQTFFGTADNQPLLGGLCNIEEHRIAGSSGGVALRCFDNRSGRWSIYWISDSDGVLQPPVHGAFHGDEGIFEGGDTDGQRPVRVRFLWKRLTPDSARWEQAFSYDQGRNWETNWIMEFARDRA